MGYHQNPGETDRLGTAVPDSVWPVAMDHLICSHWTPVGRSSGTDRVIFGGHLKMLKDGQIEIWRQKNTNAMQLMAEETGKLPPPRYFWLRQGR